MSGDRVWATHDKGAYWSWREPRTRWCVCRRPGSGGWIHKRTDWHWAVGNTLSIYYDAWYRENYEHGLMSGRAHDEYSALAAITAAITGRPRVNPYDGAEVR